MKALTTQPDPARPYGSSGLLPLFMASGDAYYRQGSGRLEVVGQGLHPVKEFVRPTQ
jgi:hypothetical protein